jgi:hypothetical protein
VSSPAVYNDRVMGAHAMSVDGVRIQSESDRWVVPEMYKSTILVLSRAQFTQAIRRGKAWKRAAAMRARHPDAET